MDRLQDPVLRGELMTAADKLVQYGVQIGIEQGVERGVEQGTKKTAEIFVRNLIKDGAELQYIVKITGLSESRVLELKKRSEA